MTIVRNWRRDSMGHIWLCRKQTNKQKTWTHIQAQILSLILLTYLWSSRLTICRSRTFYWTLFKCNSIVALSHFLILYIEVLFVFFIFSWVVIAFYRQKAWWRTFLKNSLSCFLRNGNLRERGAHYSGERVSQKFYLTRQCWPIRAVGEESWGWIDLHKDALGREE